MKLVFATTNQKKLIELKELLGDEVELVSPGTLEVDEDQPSFEGNAEKKAKAWCERFKLPALADDSGLCVDALGGRPGVLSARYAPDDASRIAKLLKELEGVPTEKRTARFRCALAYAQPGRPVRLEVGDCEGVITLAPRGSHGFGYDPIFEVKGLGKTMAELTSSEKSRISHRGRAFRIMVPHLLGG